MIAPNLDLNDPALEIAVRHGYIPGLKGPPQQEKAKMPPAQPPRSQTLPEPLEAKQENDLESMIRAVGLLDMDENGYWDYHGHSSGLSFVRRMREQLGDLMGPDTGTTPFIKSRPVSNVLDSPKSTSVESPMDSLSPTSDLPPENVARELAASALTMHSVVLRIVHVPSFWTSFKRIYTLPLEQFSNEDHKFLPLLYSALAVGIVYGGEEFPTYDMAIDKGQVTTTTNYHTPTNLNRRFRYFKAARQMMDIADIRDMTSIQAVIFMILFLQSSAKLSQCYSYIGVALRGAIRMGLHRSLPQKRFNPLELEMRKRVFWTIRKLDVYIGAMLGLPQSLSEEDIDQDDPAEVDDEFITEEGIKAMPPGTVTVMTAFNKHTKLQKILTKIVQKVYPIHVASADGPMGKSYAVSFATIKEIEREMEEWKASLPQGLDPSHDNPKLQRWDIPSVSTTNHFTDYSQGSAITSRDIRIQPGPFVPTFLALCRGRQASTGRGSTSIRMRRILHQCVQKSHPSLRCDEEAWSAQWCFMVHCLPHLLLHTITGLFRCRKSRQSNDGGAHERCSQRQGHSCICRKTYNVRGQMYRHFGCKH